MALFNGKSSAEKVIEMFDKLSDEDKEVVKSHFGEKVEDLEKAEDEREVDKIEEEKADTEEVKEDKAEDVAEESEQIGEDVNEAEAEEPAEEQGADEEIVEERYDDMFAGFDARLKALEEKFEKLTEVKEPEQKEIGLSGYGNSEVDGQDIDTRQNDMIKKLGGYAY